MPFGQVVIGSPGSGKTTYCHGLQQFFGALKRPIAVVNLDPANHTVPYEAAISLAELITVQDVMDELHLGPNGAMLYCLEYLEANLEWLDRRLAELPGPPHDRYVVFDLPGQVELSTNHTSLKHIVEHLTRHSQWQLVAVHLVDASHITDASRYIALLLLCLRAMLTLELPHINVLSKMDLLSQMSEHLAFNLDFYTEVQDLNYLLPHLSPQASTSSSTSTPRQRRFQKLNERIIELIEDFGLVGLETLAVEDRESMGRLVRLCDKATGYVFVQGDVGRAAREMEERYLDEDLDGEGGQDEDGDEDDDAEGTTKQRARRRDDYEARIQAARGGTAASAAALFTIADTGSTANGAGGGGPSHALEMQERYVDPATSALWRAHEREQWEREGKLVMERRIYEEARKVVGKAASWSSANAAEASERTSTAPNDGTQPNGIGR